VIYLEQRLINDTTRRVILAVLYDATDPVRIKTGLTFADGDWQISYDNAAPVSIAAVDITEWTIGGVYQYVIPAGQDFIDAVVKIVDQDATAVFYDDAGWIMTGGIATARFPLQS
jgi:hypothetical protein